jgi:hypothetical protein
VVGATVVVVVVVVVVTSGNTSNLHVTESVNNASSVAVNV